ncbi:hypothetical protein K1719_033305 [Acacia pycnantha]|nr:hypothetical protein K1719_033305 [Acacia pycnantha]
MLDGESAEEVADSFATKSLKFRDPWPFRIKLNSDNLRWDSLKTSAAKDFEEFISGQINEDSRKALEVWSVWIPVKVWIYDVDTGETYEAKMAKKESFWLDQCMFG